MNLVILPQGQFYEDFSSPFFFIMKISFSSSFFKEEIMKLKEEDGEEDIMKVSFFFEKLLWRYLLLF